MNTSEKTDMVSASLFAVHRDLENPRKDARGQVRGKADYRYLSLPALTDHLRPHLKAAQLFVTQEEKGGAGFVEVTTTVWHFSGQFIEFGPAFMPATGDAQQYGSARTYCRRYALAAVFNLTADADDDGKKASAPVTSAPDSNSVSQGPDTGTGASPSLPAPGVDQSEDVSLDGAASDADPSLRGGAGDGSATLDGTDELASPDQWHALLKHVNGKTKAAADLINEKNGTHYTYPAAREGATWQELVKAMA